MGEQKGFGLKNLELGRAMSGSISPELSSTAFFEAEEGFDHDFNAFVKKE